MAMRRGSEGHRFCCWWWILRVCPCVRPALSCLVLVNHHVELIKVQQWDVLPRRCAQLLKWSKRNSRRLAFIAQSHARASDVVDTRDQSVVDGDNVSVTLSRLPTRNAVCWCRWGHVAEQNTVANNFELYAKSWVVARRWNDNVNQGSIG